MAISKVPILDQDAGLPARKYKHHSLEYKLQVIESCREPGVSISSVAVAHKLNANQLHNWIRQYAPNGGAGLIRRRAAKGTSIASSGSNAFVQMPLTAMNSTSGESIRIQVQSGTVKLEVDWPVSAAAAAGAWIRALIR